MNEKRPMYQDGFGGEYYIESMPEKLTNPRLVEAQKQDLMRIKKFKLSLLNSTSDTPENI